MTSQILDGRARFNCSLAEFYLETGASLDSVRIPIPTTVDVRDGPYAGPGWHGSDIVVERIF
jgi:hypothetical protein